MKTLGAISTVVLVGLFIAFLLIIGPALLIWAVNTYAEQAGTTFQVPFNFWTWLAGFVFILLLKGSTTTKSE